MTGILKGADPVCNLVLDETEEITYELDQPIQLGIVLLRGTNV